MNGLPAHRMGPLMVTDDPALEDKARALLEGSAGLTGHLHPLTLRRVEALLRLINSYYSNRIEGHDTHPIDIERAMRARYLDDPAQRILQLESRIHVEVQEQLAGEFETRSDLNPADPDYLRRVHELFYERLPDELRVIRGDDGRSQTVVPGEWRSSHVKVGVHVPVEPGEVGEFMHVFGREYAPQRLHGLRPVLAAAASHHRLMWIHPFLDGNGRVARLFTDMFMYRIGMRGYGLWNVSRGLARSREDYLRLLAEADAPRRGDFDGRAALSLQGLKRFMTFFLDVCIDQVDYMSRQLQTDTLIERIRGYVEMRSRNMLPGPDGEQKPLRIEAAGLLRDLALRGEIPRGDVPRITGMSERNARRLARELEEEGLIESPTPKAPWRFGLPAHAAPRYFPDLYPER